MRKSKLINPIVVIIISAFFGWAAIISDQLALNISTRILIVSVSIGFFIGLISIYITLQKTRSLEKEKKKLLEEYRTVTRGFRGRFHIVEPTPEVETLLANDADLEKVRLELDKRRLELDEQQESIGWQKGSIELVDARPESAIVLTWFGMERELQRAVSRLGLLNQQNEKEKSSASKNIQLLLNDKYIDQETFHILKEMQDVRIFAVHALNARATSDMALVQVQRAILLTEKLSSLQKNTSSQKDEQ